MYSRCGSAWTECRSAAWYRRRAPVLLRLASRSWCRPPVRTLLRLREPIPAIRQLSSTRSQLPPDITLGSITGKNLVKRTAAFPYTSRGVEIDLWDAALAGRTRPRAKYRSEVELRYLHYCRRTSSMNAVKSVPLPTPTRVIVWLPEPATVNNGVV